MRLPLSGAPWLSDLPPQWPVKPIAALFIERNERNDGIGPKQLLSLSYGRVIRRDIDSNDGLRPGSYDTYQQVKEDNIVLRLIDLQNDKRSIRVGQVVEPGIITAAYVALDTDAWACPRYAFYLLLVLDILKVFYGLGSGMRQSITFSDLGRVPVAVPSDQEQLAIASYLDAETKRIDALIAEKRRLVDSLVELKSTRITEILTGEAEASQVTGDIWLPKIPTGWSLKRLKYLGQVRSGLAKGKKNDAGANTIELPYMRVANVQDGYIDLNDVALIEVAENEVIRYTLQIGDVLMNEGGDYDKLGRGAMWEGLVDKCLHQNHVFAVRLDDVEWAPWVAAVTRTSYAKFYFMNNSKQSTNLASINQTNVKEFPVVLPPVSRRNALLKTLNEEIGRIDDLMHHVEKELETLAEFRSATITDAVLGRIDVSHYMKT